MTGYEQTFYDQVPKALQNLRNLDRIADALERIATALEKNVDKDQK